MQSIRDRALLFAAALLALGLTAASYWPGLSGDFLFDDFVNLRTLGAYGPIDDAQTLLLYLTSGIADPTGRPVSLASFLLDARNWPADPWPFKRTNLLLHLLNGGLLAAALFRFEHWISRHETADTTARRAWIALLGAALWLAHPMFVSTTLYVVQRHAMLPLTFTLLALLCWDTAMRRFLQQRDVAAWLWAAPALGVLFVLAALSKANGLLAPLLVLIAYAVVSRPSLLAHSPERKRTDRAAFIMLVAPSILVLIALWLRAPDSLAHSGTRSFTFGERLLTQPRVLLDYLAQLLLPRAGGGGVFVESYPKSTGWFEPWTTLPATVALATLLFLAWRWRRPQPALAFAVLFYFAAQLVESSVVMLELYFEHRNYLPAAFLFWPLARWIVAGTLLPRVRPWLGLILPLAMLALTAHRATLWGDPALLAAMSARDQPASIRAHVVSATELGRVASSAQAAESLREALRLHDADTALAFNLVGQECATGKLTEHAIEVTRQAVLRERHWHHGVIGWLRSATALAASGNCVGLDLDVLALWLEAAKSNPHARSGPTRRQNLLHLQGLHALRAGDGTGALNLFNSGLDEIPNPDTALTQAALLGRYGRPLEGMAHLDHFDAQPQQALSRPRNMQELHRALLARSGYHRREISRLRRNLLDAAAEVARPPSDLGKSMKRKP